MKLKEITIEITQQCPNRCVHCSSLSSLSKTTCLSTEKIIEVIDDAVALGCQTINISGGEPFLHPGLKQIIDHVYKQGTKCYIYTSGVSSVDGKPTTVSEEILKSLKEKVDKYIVNVEAIDEDTYNRVMGTKFGGFGMMKQFVKNAVGLRNIVEAHFVPMKLNYHQISDVVRMCTELGISRVSFLRFVAQGRGLENESELMLNNNEMKTAMKLMLQCAADNKVNIRMGIPFSDCYQHVNCLTGTAKLNVRYDGNVYPCEAFKNDQLKRFMTLSVDNVNNDRLLNMYVNSPYLAEIRERHLAYLDVNTCETCFAQYLSNKNQ